MHCSQHIWFIYLLFHCDIYFLSIFLYSRISIFYFYNFLAALTKDIDLTITNILEGRVKYTEEEASIEADRESSPPPTRHVQSTTKPAESVPRPSIVSLLNLIFTRLNQDKRIIIFWQPFLVQWFSYSASEDTKATKRSYILVVLIQTILTLFDICRGSLTLLAMHC